MLKLTEIPAWQTFVADAVAKDPDDRTLAEENACCIAFAQATNVYDYFRQQFEMPPGDESLRELSIDSTCGDDCRTAIDSAKGLHNALRRARGDTAEDLNLIVLFTNDIIRIFWRG
jgi:hypothetical protein